MRPQCCWRYRAWRPSDPVATGALARAEDDICVAQPTAASLLVPIMSYYGLLRGISHQDSVTADSEIGRHGCWRDERSRYTTTAILAQCNHVVALGVCACATIRVLACVRLVGGHGH